ncbi:hypothetical protein BA953_24770 (plasmid) [Vibrio coralliilyticus]|nr:hypothetical protein BA953_24770 [Vibrio coralliilyticus]
MLNEFYLFEQKGSKQQALVIRKQCRDFLESKLKLTLNMEKTQITHINDGFVFLGHRLIVSEVQKATCL